MKTEFRHFSALSAVFAALLGLALSVMSCQPEGLKDETQDFYYPGITDIGPSTNLSVAPNYHGGTPSNFQITNIRLEPMDAEAQSADYTRCFSVNPESGYFYIGQADPENESTANLNAGKYYFSISAKFGGKVVEKKDVIVLNMMLAVPSGIKAEPDYLEVKLGDIVNGAKLPTSKIVTEGEHVTIKKYLLGTVTKDGELFADAAKCFEVSDNGEVSIVSKAPEILAGEYVLDFILTTTAASEESQKGLFENALTINITSEPLSLVYTPDNAVIEVGFSDASSATPAFMGSKDDLRFEILSVVPEAQVTIDENGVLNMPKDAEIAVGTDYVVSVKAVNKFGEKEFNDVFTFNAIEFIDPITKFSYNEPEKIIESKALTVTINEMDGKYVTYSIVEVPDAIKPWLTIDSSTGTLTLPKGNTVYAGTYPVKVKAHNAKTDMETTVNIVIDENINFFTHVSYGNNLGEGYENEADQFRIPADASYPLTFEIKSSDIKESAKEAGVIKYSFASGGRNTTGISIDEATGQITVTEATANISYVIVEVQVGEGSEAISIKTPVFFQFPGSITQKNMNIEFTPFAAKINPKTGGIIPPPALSGSAYTDRNTFQMDYRRSFSYSNIYGPESHLNGAPTASGSFLQTLWEGAGYFGNANKGPVSLLGIVQDKKDPDKVLAYVIQDAGPQQYGIKVIENKWIKDGEYANGIFCGQITFINDYNGNPDNKQVNNGTQIFPIAIWFDTKF